MSSITYGGTSYSRDSTVNGKWIMKTRVTFTHQSPTDAQSYSYRLTVNFSGGNIGQLESTDQISQYYYSSTNYIGWHAGNQSHEMVCEWWGEPNKTYNFIVLVEYRVNGGEWKASKLKTSTQTITLKADSASVAGGFRNVNVSTTPSSAAFSWQYKVNNYAAYAYRWNIYISQSSTYPSSPALHSTTDTVSSVSSSDLWYSFPSGSDNNRVSNLSNNTTYRYKIVMYAAPYGTQSAFPQIDSYEGSFTTGSSTPPQPLYGEDMSISFLRMGSDSNGSYAEFSVSIQVQGYADGTTYGGYVIVSSTSPVDADNVEFWIQDYDKMVGDGEVSWTTKVYVTGGVRKGETWYYGGYILFKEAGDSTWYYWTDSKTTTASFYTGDPILNWSWTNKQGSWNAVVSTTDSNLVSTAYTAINNGGETTSFSHLVWNDIIDWLIYVLNSVNKTVTYYPNIVYMSDSDKVLTADRWNEMMKLQSPIARSGFVSPPNNVKSGDEVKGVYIKRIIDPVFYFVVNQNGKF